MGFVFRLDTPHNWHRISTCSYSMNLIVTREHKSEPINKMSEACGKQLE